MRKPTLLLVLGMLGCWASAAHAQPKPAVEHPGVDARNRIKDLQAKFRRDVSPQDALRSLAVLDELFGELHSMHRDMDQLLSHQRDPKVRQKALVMKGALSRGTYIAPQVVKELGEIAAKERIPGDAVGAYLGLVRMGPEAASMVPTAREGRKHKDPEIRRAAFQFILSRFFLSKSAQGKEELLPDIIAALDDPDMGPDEKRPGFYSVSWLAMLQLRDLPEATAKEAASKLMKIIRAKKGDADYELTALSRLAEIEPENPLTLQIARGWLKEADGATVRKGAGLVRELGAHGKDALPELIAAAKREAVADPKEERATKIAILQTFQKLGTAAREALPTIEKLAVTDDRETRREVLLAIDAVLGRK
jgi:hypothetical protein